MSNVVRMPIETYRKGDKITKICVEDINKMVERIGDAVNKAKMKSDIILDESFKQRRGELGYFIIGTGRSTPCMTDAFDEEIGNSIAFMKAKLNANIKKHNLLCRVYNEFVKCLDTIDEDLSKIDEYIVRDLEGIRMYNPNYLSDIESRLGI